MVKIQPIFFEEMSFEAIVDDGRLCTSHVARRTYNDHNSSPLANRSDGLKIITFKGVTYFGKCYFPYFKEQQIEEIIRSLRGQILSCKRSFHFERDVIDKLGPIVAL